MKSMRRLTLLKRVLLTSVLFRRLTRLEQRGMGPQGCLIGLPLQTREPQGCLIRAQ